ncbi:DUF6119 family protein [Methanoplanus endosymbiosus]|uniref:TIGR04141 family sporadically distributed protein n=1 Tax=Methanoplanus endosymbiosus TaxID=33865 RepID=A0A9E7TLG5_9EURY|nr:DUF6119 family protein [Methanoplanus endosymbiosus]UUX93809.1 TIGR04141 family sporadically distributed protein [Methanoplanus endosymbiosus]
MVKSRSFSIYLLKKGFSAENSLKEHHELIENITADNLPDGATLFLLDKNPSNPWWKDFWKIKTELKQTLKGAIVFLPVYDRCFAFTFGHTYHNLKEESYEYDFGLRSTLNAVDPDKLKSTDILQPENAKRESIQSSNTVNLTFFDFDKDESIVKRISGKVKEEYRYLFSNVTGANSIRIDSKLQARELPELCRNILALYNKDDFKIHFPDIQNIIPVKDPNIISKLNKQLLKVFREELTDIALTVPEIINYQENFQINYSIGKNNSETHDDAHINHYIKFFKSRNISPDEIDIGKLNKHNLNICDENRHIIQSFSIYKSLLFDCEFESKHYHICEGKWYELDKDYIVRLKKQLDPYFKNNILPKCDYKREDSYNKHVSDTNHKFICLDKKNISPKGQSSVEPCDLYTSTDNKATLIHIKISTRSANLSHLFNQGLNSAEIIRLHEESKDKLKKLIGNKDTEIIDGDKFEVIYGIITAKNPDKKSNNLPIFSRISLLRCINSFKLMGLHVSIMLIEDEYDRKK